MSEIPTIGDVVREWRQYWQISLTDFCQQTKLSKGYVSELEHNKIDNPKKDKLKILAKALRITEMDIVSRRMPSKDGAAKSTPSSQQGVAGQGRQQVSADQKGDGEAHAQEQESEAPTYSVVNPAIGIPDSLVSTLGKKTEEIEYLIVAACLPEDEEEEIVAALVEVTKQFVKIKKDRAKRKEG